MHLEVPIVGLASERRQLSHALQNRKSVLLLGPPGSGKTTLLRWALQTASDALYLPHTPVLHDLLVSLAQKLDLMAPHSRQTSLHLKGILWQALEAKPRIIMLDGIRGAGHRTFRFLERLFYTRGMALIAATRDLRTLGALTRLFWDPRSMIQIQPLTENESEQLFESAAQRFGLQPLALDEFRDQVLEAAQGNPGQIVEMCRLASDPRYVSGKHIKFAPLRIDALIKFMG